jgi:glycosyltransferase involved in cell wall biosynthesis
MGDTRENGWGGRYCIVIPAFDVEQTIGDVVRRSKLLGLEVLVVDDGSRDQTAAVASKQGALVISHLQNQGKGSALRTAFDYALRHQFDGVITLDADGQHLPEEVPRLVKAGAAVVRQPGHVPAGFPGQPPARAGLAVRLPVHPEGGPRQRGAAVGKIRD